jgi:hypothetical protein
MAYRPIFTVSLAFVKINFYGYETDGTLKRQIRPCDPDEIGRDKGHVRKTSHTRGRIIYSGRGCQNGFVEIFVIVEVSISIIQKVKNNDNITIECSKVIIELPPPRAWIFLSIKSSVQIKETLNSRFLLHKLVSKKQSLYYRKMPYN